MLISIVAVKWYYNRGGTLVGTCLEGCNQISSVSCRIKDKSVKIPVPCPLIEKEYSNGMGGADLLDQRTVAYKLDGKSSSGRYYLRFFFGLMNIAKSLIGAYNSHTSCRKVLLASVPLHLPVIQTTRSKCRCCYNAGIENKTYMQCNNVEYFYALFLVTIQETVLLISILRFKYA